MTGMLSSLFTAGDSHAALVVAVVTLLLGWWAGVALVTLRSHHAGGRSAANAPPTGPDQARSTAQVS